MIRIGICDDMGFFVDEITRLAEKELLKSGIEYEFFGCSDGQTLLSADKRMCFDIVFLDIAMPDMDGFKAAEKLKAQNEEVHIVFVTSKNDLVYKSFNYQPFNFIYKFDTVSLEKNIARIIKQLLNHMSEKDVVVLLDNNMKMQAVRVFDIIYIESDKHYLNYYTTKESDPIRIRGTVKQKAEEYKNLNFFKPHQKYLINLKHVAKINYSLSEIQMSDGTKLPLSKHVKKEFDTALRKYLYRRQP